MAARLQQFTNDIQEKVRKHVSQFSQEIRLRLEMETNFKENFDGVFDQFVGNALPNPEILRKIQEEEDPELAKERKKREAENSKP